MFIEKIIKVKLEDEEKEALKLIYKTIDRIFTNVIDCDEDIEFEDEVRDVLLDLSDTIRRIV